MLRVVSTDPLDEPTRREMQVSRRRFRLARLLRSTEEILVHAQQSDWPSVERLEQQRQMELAACFAETDADDSPEVVQALATLVDMNRQITELVKQAKQVLIEQQQLTETRQRAVEDYYSNS